MIVGSKDVFKTVGVFVIALCAVFVCTLFLNYQLDLIALRGEISAGAGQVWYEAKLSMGKVVCGVTGGCLCLTACVLLFFYIKNYIDSHKRQLGVFKAMGVSRFRVAKDFWVFGAAVFLGCGAGFVAAMLYAPAFYRAQNVDGVLPHMAVGVHPLAAAGLIVLPGIFFSLLSVFFAMAKLKRPAAELLRGVPTAGKRVREKEAQRDVSFLKGLQKNVLRERPLLAFLLGFSAFCFSSMTQMALSMRELSSESFGWMIALIGLILAYSTLFLSLFEAVKANGATVALMRAFGYRGRVCFCGVFGAYLPAVVFGFLLGTGYQYLLLKSVMYFVFRDIAELPEYHFSGKWLALSVGMFLLSYGALLLVYAKKLSKTSLRLAMAE